MHNDLVIAFQKVVEILVSDKRCKGGWHFGSISRGTQDVNLILIQLFLVADKYFESFSGDVHKNLEEVSDELLLLWAEDFNDEYFKN